VDVTTFAGHMCAAGMTVTMGMIAGGTFMRGVMFNPLLIPAPGLWSLFPLFRWRVSAFSFLGSVSAFIKRVCFPDEGTGQESVRFNKSESMKKIKNEKSRRQ